MLLITSLLFPEYRQRVLGLLLLHPETRYHVREIARLTNTAAGSLHRELSKLAKAQVLIREVSGNQVYYQANSAFLIFEELVSILRKTSGLVDILANALSPLAEKIAVAFVFGSMGSGTENRGSDVDVLIIGELSFIDAVTALYSAQASIGREINPKIYKKAEWKKLINNKNAFVQEILNKPKLFIIGTVNDLK
jgi:predicted nucleotidyltransferase